LLKTALALLVAPWLRPGSAKAQDGSTSRPQKNDVLVYAFGDKAGQPIDPETIEAGKGLLLAYPMDPESKTVRSGSRLNQLILVRLDPAEFTDQTRAYTAAGVVAYSSVCTHMGCPLNGWYPDKKVIKCYCHFSVYDPKDYGRVVEGPAPRRLAILPLVVSGGLLTAAAEFQGRVGFTPV
jgi:Rieske Fe-S protein